MSNTLVSIIIPIYNRSGIIEHTLNSIIAQKHTNWECIIIDDGSTDDTVKIVTNYKKQDSRFQLFNRPKNMQKGANACRNYGFKKAKGEYINWFDSDDIMHSEFIALKVESFNKTTDAVLHRNKYSNYVLTRFRESKYVFDEQENLLYYYLNEDIEIQTCGFMWRKSFLVNKLLFNETIHRYQDNEFHIRILATKPLVKALPNVLATIRGGDGDDSQISSSSNLTKKKLLDIFYFRCQSIKISNGLNLDVVKHKVLSKKLLKKAIWAFYEVMYFEKNMNNKLKDLKQNWKSLKCIYSNKYFSLKERIKSFVYIIFIVLFRKIKN